MPRRPKPVVLTKEEIKNLAANGCTDKHIAIRAGISESTLQKRFRKELDEGRAELRETILKAQIELAVKKQNATMLIWLGKQYLGQRDVLPLRIDENELEQKLHNVVIELTDASNSKPISTTSETNNN